MVAPLQLKDPALQRAYVALAGNTKIEAKDVEKLLGAARADDGRIDAVEKRDLQRVLAHNKDLFGSGAEAQLRAGLDERPLYTLGGTRPAGLAGQGLGGMLGSLGQRSPQKDTPPPSFGLGGARVPLRLGQLGGVKVPADATAVKKPLERAPASSGLRLPQHTLSAADPRTLTPEYRAAAQARVDAQSSIDRQCALDPFAARVNGMWQSPSGHWTKVGPSPLEVVAQTGFAASVPGRVYGAVTAGKAVYTAIDDPTAGNIGTAALKVGLTGGGEYAKLVHAPIKPVITGTKGLYNAQTSTPGE